MGVEGNIAVAGVRLHRLASSGARALEFAQLPAVDWQTGIVRLKPSIVIIQLATNEMANNNTPASQATNLTTMIARVRAAAPYADILLAPPVDNGLTGNTYAIADYIAAQYALANTLSAGLVSSAPRFGTYAQSSLLGLWTNTSHVNATGAAILSRNVLD
jgi:lysophospholipase L1-like esterase